MSKQQHKYNLDNTCQNKINSCLSKRIPYKVVFYNSFEEATKNKVDISDFSPPVMIIVASKEGKFITSYFSC